MKSGTALALIAATAVLASTMTGSFILRAHAWDYTTGYQKGLETGRAEVNDTMNREASVGGICLLYKSACLGFKVTTTGAK